MQKKLLLFLVKAHLSANNFELNIKWNIVALKSHFSAAFFVIRTHSNWTVGRIFSSARIYGLETEKKQQRPAIEVWISFPLLLIFNSRLSIVVGGVKGAVIGPQWELDSMALIHSLAHSLINLTLLLHCLLASKNSPLLYSIHRSSLFYNKVTTCLEGKCVQCDGLTMVHLEIGNHDSFIFTPQFCSS